jgi:alpha-methylacyl-CoA racemase
MVDGAASLMSAIYGLYASDAITNERGTNVLDSGAHFYGVYETSDHRYVSVGSIEQKFYDELEEKLGITLADRNDPSKWPGYKEQLAAIFATKTRDEWCEIMEGSDICFAPVLDMDEAPHHPHNVVRNVFVDVEGVVQPGPAPRFSRTPAAIQSSPADPGQHTDEALADWGFSANEIEKLRQAGAVN